MAERASLVQQSFEQLHRTERPPLLPYCIAALLPCHVGYHVSAVRFTYDIKLRSNATLDIQSFDQINRDERRQCLTIRGSGTRNRVCAIIVNAE